MTIRLLCAYGPYPANAIVTLDAGTEAGLIATKQAESNLTGGVVYVPPVAPPNGPIAASFSDSNGTSLVRPDGTSSAVGIVLAASGAAATAPLDTSDNTLATITIPAGIMGPNAVVQVRTLWSMTSSANAKNMRVKFGGNTYMDVSLTTQATEHVMVCIRNAGSTAAQKGWIASNVIGLGSSGSPLITSTVDTRAAVSLLITGVKASGAESLVLEAYDVVLYS